jgi:hypothetical protein
MPCQNKNPAWLQDFLNDFEFRIAVIHEDGLDLELDFLFGYCGAKLYPAKGVAIYF